ncbi:polyprenol monophosphomannose synthase [Plantibacter sp. YIM 135347]|uniref:polyprenol monophosphomannose synthase n=1 Tax=Plantibacter sp. YIM 135347 TaxID=3423919 RepID=UPI003D348DB5
MSQHHDQHESALVIVPTYNERENLRIVIDDIHRNVPWADILVVDDGSPDGTGELAEEIHANDSRINVLHRSGKLGLGSAYIMGFQWGLARDYQLLIEMDADGSHPAVELPAMLRISEQAAARPDLVIGSRWTPGGSVVDWPRHRELLSRGGNTYANMMLGLKVHDATAGYRVYRASTLSDLELEGVDSRGYCFQVDMTLRVLDQGGTIIEHPIEFRDRVRGTSKMSQAIVLEAMSKVTLWGVQRRWRRLTRRSSRSPRQQQP